MMLPLVEFPLPALWGNAIGFTILFTAMTFGVGLASRNLSIGAFGGFLVFQYMVIEADLVALQPIVYVVLTLILVSFGFKLWRTEGLE